MNIEYEPFIGESNITVTVSDFGLGELADTVQFLLTVQGDLLLDDGPIPDKFSLGHAYPNPFNPVVTIPFTIDKPRDVSIHIFDISGRKVNTILQDQFLHPGLYHKNWNGCNYQGRHVSTGTYIIQIASETELHHQKITLIK